MSLSGLIKTATQTALEHVTIGRAQLAREVRQWIHANAHRMGEAPIGELLALLDKELQK